MKARGYIGVGLGLFLAACASPPSHYPGYSTYSPPPAPPSPKIEMGEPVPLTSQQMKAVRDGVTSSLKDPESARFGGMYTCNRKRNRMPSLRAFVGHSFTEDDEELIRKFEKHFDDLELAQPEFTWDHALRAEPVSVSEKVLKLAADKNVFVAICTRKEQVLLRPYPRSWFERLTLKETDFEWKTSDWIIQETGLAKGKGLATTYPSLRFLCKVGLRSSRRPRTNQWWRLKILDADRCRPEPQYKATSQRNRHTSSWRLRARTL